MSELEQTLADLSAVRKEHELVTSEFKKGMEEAKQRLYSLSSAMVDKANQIAALEAKARTLALAQFALDGNKHPCDGIAIKMVKKVDYREDAAFQWAKDSGLCLKFDAAAFEKTAKANSQSMPYWCKISEVPQATISKTLQ